MKKRTKRHPESAAETLDQLQSMGDRFAEWIGENPYIILGVAAGILIVAGGYGLITATSESTLMEGASDLAKLEAEYRTAMGASSDDLEIPEPANPETAKQVRTEYAARFAALQAEQAGNPAAALAALHLVEIQEALGEIDAALATLERALEGGDPGSPMRAILLRRRAVLLENRGDWTGAANAYEAASTVLSFPLRYDSLADAARCYAEAGQKGEALAAFDRIQNEAPDHDLPSDLASRLAELRVAP